MHAYAESEPVDGDERERLILEHLPQVRLIARRIQERLPDNVALEDLVSSGVIGLISAIDHFDASHNVKLKTYAEYKIRGAILDSLRGLDWAPRQKRRRAKQIEAAIVFGAARRFEIAIGIVRIVNGIGKSVTMIEKAPDQFDGNGKTQAFAEGDLHVGYADNLAGEIEQRAAAVAGIDLRGGLQVKLAFDLARLGAENARRHRTFQSHRTADGKH